MANKNTEKRKIRPYQHGWIDRFTYWVENLPLHAWIFYSLFGIGLIVIQILFLWLDGGLQEGELLPIIVFNGLFVPLLLGLIALFDHQAVSALNSMRPVLNITESDFDQFEYRLSNMPAFPSLVAGLMMLVFVIIMEQISTVPIRYAALERLPIFVIVFHIIDKSSAYLFGVIIYHTIRQLLLVNVINSTHMRINLFDLGPFRAFSSVTASTAVGLLVGIYGWMLINPDLLADPFSYVFLVIITILAVVVFVWPLYGVHRRMAVEKEKELQEINHRFESLFSKFNTGLHDEDFSAIENLSGTITSLEIQQRKIESISTWPWRPEAFRSVLTAIALPLVLMILQFLLEQALNR